MSDLALMRSISEEVGNPSTIVIRDKSKHTFTDIASGVESVAAGDMTAFYALTYATNRAFAYKQLSATLGVIVYCQSATMHPQVQGVVWSGLVPSLGSAVDYDTGTAYPDKGCTYVSMARLTDNRAFIAFKYAGRTNITMRSCTVSNLGAVTMENTGETVWAGVTVPRVCECSSTQILIVYDRSVGTTARYISVDESGVLNYPGDLLALDNTVTVPGDPCAAMISATQWLVIWRGYTVLGNYISVVEIYDNAGSPALGTVNNIDDASIGEGAFGRNPRVCVADATVPTCVVLYSDATGQNTSKTWARVITVNADHTNTASATTEINASMSNQLGLETLADSYVAGCYRPTESGVNQNDLSVFIGLAGTTLTIPVGFELWANDEAAVTEAVLGLTGTVDIVAMFVDTVVGNGLLQVFDVAQTTASLTDTPVSLIQVRNQRVDDYTIDSFRQSGGADVRSLTTFMSGG